MGRGYWVNMRGRRVRDIDVVYGRGRYMGEEAGIWCIWEGVYVREGWGNGRGVRVIWSIWEGREGYI